MKRLMSSVLLICCAMQACARGGLADVRVVSRDTGAVLETHWYRGEYWVAGNPGERYAIEIRNRLGERLLAVTSVDGINVVSGETAAWDQTGYVFSSGEDYRITGWRKSDAEVAAFSFTSSADSYADRTGRPRNVGVIGVALFREKAIDRRAEAPPVDDLPRDRGVERESPRAPESLAYSTDSAQKSLQGSSNSMAPGYAPTPAPSLGTAHGSRESSFVSHTDFERSQSTPNEVIRIRYDSMANLVAMGVIHRQRPSQPNPFPDTIPYRYVPDPPG